MAGVRRRAFTCVGGDPIWQVTSRSSEVMGFPSKSYIGLYTFTFTQSLLTPWTQQIHARHLWFCCPTFLVWLPALSHITPPFSAEWKQRLLAMIRSFDALPLASDIEFHPVLRLYFTCSKNYEHWLAVDKVIAKISRLTIFWPTLYIVPLVFLAYVLRQAIKVHDSWLLCMDLWWSN